MLDKITRVLGRGALLAQKHAPELLTAAGIIGGVAAGVMGAKAAKDNGKYLEVHRKQLQEDVKDKEKRGYYSSPSDKGRDIGHAYGVSFLEYAKVYGPAVGLGVSSIACILWGHGILKGRNAALAAAYTTLDTAFKKYRERVVEAYGEEVDKQFVRGDVGERESEDGEQSLSHEAVGHPYSFIFDESSSEWSRDPGYNETFLRTQQSMWNDRLRTKGHVFLNEILDSLGLPHTSTGAIVGWIYDGAYKGGDGYIDFGIEYKRDHDAATFAGSWERAVWLDFNVDGVIFDKIDNINHWFERG